LWSIDQSNNSSLNSCSSQKSEGSEKCIRKIVRNRGIDSEEEKTARAHITYKYIAQTTEKAVELVESMPPSSIVRLVTRIAVRTVRFRECNWDQERKRRSFQLISGRIDQSRRAGTSKLGMISTWNREKSYSHDE
jgi:hypothetical protein